MADCATEALSTTPHPSNFAKTPTEKVQQSTKVGRRIWSDESYSRPWTKVYIFSISGGEEREFVRGYT